MYKKRFISAALFGFLGGLMPNDNSNIHPVLLGIIFALLFTKIIFGDFDKGYQWSFFDLHFILLIGGIGGFTAFLASKFY
jgi:hypothetical protein